MRRTLTICAVLLTALVLQGCVYSAFRAERTMTQSLDHLPGSPLVVNSRNGRVEVRASDAYSDVAIEATIKCAGATQQEADERLALATLQVERDTSRTLSIKPIFPGSPRGGDGASIIVHLPDADGVTIDTSNGSVTVSGATGRLFADTSNGPIKVFDHVGEVILDTSNGSVTVERLVGNLRLDTSNGSVKAVDVEGNAHIDTSNASVNVVNLAGSARIDTSNGSITLTLRDDQPGPIVLDTSNASIRATVGAAFAGRLTMDTSNAGVYITDNVGIITRQNTRKSFAELVMAAEGAGSRLNTSNGRIVLTIE